MRSIEPSWIPLLIIPLENFVGIDRLAHTAVLHYPNGVKLPHKPLCAGSDKQSLNDFFIWRLTPNNNIHRPIAIVEIENGKISESINKNW